jgi:hypothetical protein
MEGDEKEKTGVEKGECGNGGLCVLVLRKNGEWR